jgi:hypothetical protein
MQILLPRFALETIWENKNKLEHNTKPFSMNAYFNL